MQVKDLGQGISLFMFDPPEGELEGLNFLALIEGGEAFFLDTGYKENMAEALAWLGERGVRPVGALISHYHPDHADGLALLEGMETWGSALYQETLDHCFRPARHAALAPRHPVSNYRGLDFHGHSIEIIPLPGHTIDSLGARIDGRIFYAADTLLFTNDGKPVLPSVHARPIAFHASALRKLGEYSGLDFVPGHGAPVLDLGTRERDLANRLAYIEAIAARPGIGLEEAQAGCDPKFLGSEWHEENWK